MTSSPVCVRHGCGHGRIRYEFFGPALALQVPSRASQEDIGVGSDGGKVVFAGSGVEATWDGQGFLFELAESAELMPPCSCRVGICQTCQCEAVDGEVVYDEEPLSPLGPGKVLICVGKPKGRAVLDL